MTRSVLLVPAALLVACAGPFTRTSPRKDPLVFTGAPRCDYTELGTFTHSSDIFGEVLRRHGDAAILVRQDNAGTLPGVGGDDGRGRAIYSGRVVRFTDQACTS